MKKWLIAAAIFIGFFRLRLGLDGRASLQSTQSVCKYCNMRAFVWHICDR